MRYLIALVDGLADTPLPALGGKTPLETATAPTLDKLATSGRLGAIRTVPRDHAPETLAALFTLLGYPPGPYLTGRGYYEALAAGLILGEGEWCFRLQFVTTADGKLADARAGGLTDAEGAELLRALEANLRVPGLRLVPGSGHNHLALLEGTDFRGLSSVNPFNVVDLPFAEHLPEGPGAELLRKIMTEAGPVLAKHEINRVRLDLKQNPANAVWLWGGGTAVEVPGFMKTFGLDAALVSYSSLVRGVGVAAGMKVMLPGESPLVPDPSGRLKRVEGDEQARRATETDEITRALETVRKALAAHSMVVVHFSYPDDYSHVGDAQGKVRAIELLDRHFFKPLQPELEQAGDVRLVVLSTLMSRVETRRHEEGPVPFLMWGPGVESRWQLTLTESNANETGIRIEDGTRLVDYIINGL
ncbi:MAG: hypothetical protein IT463_08440 [Planctomycetes bacterium]|nr:hypothetical protein [Planctomycetota bacterium]